MTNSSAAWRHYRLQCPGWSATFISTLSRCRALMNCNWIQKEGRLNQNLKYCNRNCARPGSQTENVLALLLGGHSNRDLTNSLRLIVYFKLPLLRTFTFPPIALLTRNREKQIFAYSLILNIRTEFSSSDCGSCYFGPSQIINFVLKRGLSRSCQIPIIFKKFVWKRFRQLAYDYG